MVRVQGPDPSERHRPDQAMRHPRSPRAHPGGRTPLRCCPVRGGVLAHRGMFPSAVPFAAIAAVVPGFVLAASGAFAHDSYTSVVRGGQRA